MLVVDDEPHILRALQATLRGAGYEVVTAATGEEALRSAAIRPPKAVILDLVLPDRHGAEVCRELRAWSEAPILVLSAVGDEGEKVAALDAGADDYVTKPFGTEELLARLRALTHPAILREVWGPAYDAESHYLHVYVSQLRRKLEPDPARPRYLLTEPGAGYRLVNPLTRET
ncbi:MAG: response regulator transcription factor [Actinobacteria bacterium]|nr:MAG: response regulator transcription factor [Actinomycetota bacterium]